MAGGPQPVLEGKHRSHIRRHQEPGPRRHPTGRTHRGQESHRTHRERPQSSHPPTRLSVMIRTLSATSVQPWAFGARWNWFCRTYNCPSASTIRSLFAEIDIEELERRIGAWLFTRARRGQEGLLVLALDGKVLRGAWLDDRQQFTLFSAMIHGIGVTVGQLRVPPGSPQE